MDEAPEVVVAPAVPKKGFTVGEKAVIVIVVLAVLVVLVLWLNATRIFW